jgi:NAD(P)-dependent dehydrogenase (short-subunit alcohol dehydrogenase family)
MSVAVVTGTSSGIGLKTCVRLAKQGYQVFAGMRNLEKAGPLRVEAAEHNLDIEIVELDVNDDDSVARAFTKIRESGAVDVLVNNAGFGAGSPLELTPIEEHQAIFNTNYFGAIRCINTVLGEMRNNKLGTIVNITSIEGVMAFPNQIAYSASKWALECAGEALAHEVYRFGIRVVNIEPGVIMTNIFDNAKPFTRYEKTSPYQPLMRRNGKFFAAGMLANTQPERVAETIIEAIETPNYKLRWLVGDDAESLDAGRRAMSDEQWIAMGDELSDEDYNARFKEHFGITL